MEKFDMNFEMANLLKNSNFEGTEKTEFRRSKPA